MPDEAAGSENEFVSAFEARLNCILVDGAAVTSDRSFEDRTNQKLAFAKLYLDLRIKCENTGGVAERAHEESFLFHLIGVIDAFEQEVKHACGLRSARNTPVWQIIEAMKHDEAGWLWEATRYRNFGMHQSGIGHQFHVGGDRDGMVEFKDTKTSRPLSQTIPEYLNRCLESMTALITQLRSQLPR
jgi:hypothetical protein